MNKFDSFKIKTGNIFIKGIREKNKKTAKLS